MDVQWARGDFKLATDNLRNGPDMRTRSTTGCSDSNLDEKGLDELWSPLKPAKTGTLERDPVSKDLGRPRTPVSTEKPFDQDTRPPAGALCTEPSTTTSL